MSSLEKEVADFFKRLLLEDERHDLIKAKRAYESSWFKDYKQDTSKLERHLAGMTNHQLSELEATLVLSYTARTSSWTNQHLHDSLAQDANKVRYEHNILLARVLEKIPQYELKTVFRIDFNSPASHDSKNFYPWINKRIGQIVHVPYFWSTSKERWDDKCLTWKIQTGAPSNARDISDLTQSPTEKEVLFIAGSNFRIEEVDRKNNLISVTEVASAEYDVPLIGLYYRNY